MTNEVQADLPGEAVAAVEVAVVSAKVTAVVEGEGVVEVWGAKEVGGSGRIHYFGEDKLIIAHTRL